MKKTDLAYTAGIIDGEGGHRMTTEFISGECICPAPMMSEIDRQKLISEMRKSIYTNKCIIDKEWRVRNPVFDKKGEKTTTKVRIRPARTIDEVEFIIKELTLG